MFFTIITLIYTFWNLYAFFRMTREEMVENLIDKQTPFTGIFANLFYAPAWILKLIFASYK